MMQGQDGVASNFFLSGIWETGKGALRDTLPQCARLRSLLGFHISSA